MTLEEAVTVLLWERNLTLSTAESCTGGAIAARIVNVPGASEVLMQGMVTYSNRAKQNTLGVKEETLKLYGAVSEECAREMAQGGCSLQGLMSVFLSPALRTGRRNSAKPVGTVFMGCCVKGKTVVREYHFIGSRARVREQTVAHGLAFLRSCILENG